MAEEPTPDELASNMLDIAPSMPFDLVRHQYNPKTEQFEQVSEKIRVRLITVEQSHEAIQRAQAYAKSRKEDSRSYSDIYTEAQAIEVLTIAVCQPERTTLPDGKMFYGQRFVNAEHMRKALTQNEMAYLLNCFEVVKGFYGSMESVFNREEVETWVAKLSDPVRGPFFLAQLDSAHWLALLLSVAEMAAEQSRSLGRELTDLLGFSESDPENSDTGTTSSSGQHNDTSGPKAAPLPSATTNNVEVPTDREAAQQLSRELARKKLHDK